LGRRCKNPHFDEVLDLQGPVPVPVRRVEALFFPQSSLLLKLQRNPVKPCAPGCWRGLAGKMKEVILMVQKNYTIHMNLGNLAIL